MFTIDRRLICRECFLSNVIARANTERRSLWISSRFGLNQTHATVSICRIFCNAGGDGGPGNIGVRTGDSGAARIL